MPVEMSTAPRPLFLPTDPEEFTSHVTTHGADWFDYCRRVDEYVVNTEPILTESQQQTRQLPLQNQALQEEIDHLRQQLATEESTHRQTRAALQAIIEYQKGQLKEKEQDYINALTERNQAVQLVAPTVNTPARIPEPATEVPAAAPVGAPASIDSLSAASAQLSERLPDPDKFEGDRKDLRRFVSQIKEKMTVNYDRFPTSQSRMAYVTNRLKGAPYAQVLPYIHNGVCQLSDYGEVLEILERAFGDPNRARNARNDLYRLRQGNKEFSIFFAEFQRLAMEGDMPEAALPTMLEQAINRELKAMLLHHDLPNGDYMTLARFLQNLENRRFQYENNPRNHAVAPKLGAATPARPDGPSQHTTAPRASPAVETARSHPDAMDLSSARQYTTSRRDRGECFRCGSKDHLVRNCPLPDSRPVGVRPAYLSPRSQSPASLEPTSALQRYRSPSPDLPAKGMSLA